MIAYSGTHRFVGILVLSHTILYLLHFDFLILAPPIGCEAARKRGQTEDHYAMPLQNSMLVGIFFGSFRSFSCRALADWISQYVLATNDAFVLEQPFGCRQKSANKVDSENRSSLPKVTSGLWGDTYRVESEYENHLALGALICFKALELEVWVISDKCKTVRTYFTVFSDVDVCVQHAPRSPLDVHAFAWRPLHWDDVEWNCKKYTETVLSF